MNIIIWAALSSDAVNPGKHFTKQQAAKDDATAKAGEVTQNVSPIKDVATPLPVDPGQQ